MMRNIAGSRVILFLIAISLSACKTDPVMVSGSDIYSKYCVTCHQADGMGVQGAFPPLAENEWSEGDEGRLIRLVINGMQGPIEVSGSEYNNVMTPHGFLTDDQIANVLTYVRTSFGNDADPVSADQVTRVRATIGSDELYVASRLFLKTGVPD